MLRVLLGAAFTVVLSPVLLANEPTPPANPAPVADTSSPRQTTMLILDGSNSMWGQLNKVNKIITARESIRTLLESAEGNIQFGLLTYGSEGKKTGCNDFNLVVKPENYDLVKVLKEVYKLKPKGRSPIAAALKEAAQQLPTENAHILLVSDGIESCEGDPCATAQQLVEANPSLQIDVVGFRAEKEAQLECIAENGRGAFVVATDTERLKTLLAGVQAKAVGITEAAKPTRTLIDKKSQPGSVELNILAEGNPEPLRANYSIYHPDGTNVVNFSARNRVTEYLPPGEYRVKAIWQTVEKSENVTIHSGKATPLTFNIGPTGELVVNALNKTQQPVAVNYAVYTTKGEFISRHVFQESMKTRLAVGEYRIKALLDKKILEASLKVTQDAVTDYTFNFTDK
ncbi:VWA domain-containing protein [uncultured Thiothrix sp.]|uniref:vWA domain-containing protein n=1 Tax=uncultured Thiothrix sp. TaxID=223185 RepID=UPI002625472E|nr:VWA domain-containing protein [uncultured Thiothrix sp.]HMT91382.1 VWA domain-containing protein [Thiolinea sp.]